MVLATAAQMREIDRIAIQEKGISSLTLMERAAEGVVYAAEDLAERGEETRVPFRPSGRGQVSLGEHTADYTVDPAPGRRRAAVFAGHGNNGGDGLAAARLLAGRGWEVRVFLVGNRGKLTPDAAVNAERLSEAGLALEEWPADFPADTAENCGLLAWCAGCDVLVDALFGVGLSRPVTGCYAAAVMLMNSVAVPVVAVDIASGLSSDTGRVLGGAVRAAVTVTFTVAKAGQLADQGEQYTGRLIIHDIGIPEEILWTQELNTEAVDAVHVKNMLPERAADGHKGNFGRAFLLCGSTAYTGAPVLAARAAGRGGCGLVTVGIPAAAWGVVAARCLEEMPLALPDRDGQVCAAALPALEERAMAADAVLIGPGLGRGGETEEVVRRLAAACPAPLVLDADGINAFSGHIHELDVRRGRVTVLTPHDGEFARLGGDLTRGRLEAAREFARDHDCILVLKGHRTIVASPDGRCYVNTTGNSGMAKGGSGDVLAGLLTSLLAQGMEPAAAAAAAVWVHGRAGDLAAAELTAYAMAAGDLIRFLPAAFRELCEKP